MQELEFLKIGAIVENRSRLWRVDAIEGKTITVTAIDGTHTERHRFYIPIEDFRPSKLPKPDYNIVGNFAAQNLMLRAFKLSLIHGTAPLISLQQSRVIPTEYQLIPVLMALELPRVRMLLADDIGLGKTIEAGLILSELLGRQLISRILIITPASLREQWRESMDYFFHLDFRIISTRHRRTLERELPPGANPWEYNPYLITSIDYAKRPIIRNLILEQQWDLVVFDEAHNVAKPHQSSEHDKITMERWEFAQAIASQATHLLFLTATPHNGYRDTYASLLRMLVPEGVTGPVHEPEIHRDRLLSHVCQRRREDVIKWFSKAPDIKSPFPKRDQREIYRNPSTEQIIAINQLVTFGDHILSVVDEGTKFQRRMANWTIMHFHKRAISSPQAFRISLKNRIKIIQEKIAVEEEGAPTGITEDEIRANVLDEDPGEKINDEEVSLRTDRATFGDIKTLKTELKLIEETLQLAKKITPQKDEKLQDLLRNILPTMLREYPKVLIFTRYKDTLNYLEQQISKVKRFESLKITTLYGGIDESVRRDYIKEYTNARSGILIATDCISEGMNLQHAANQLIHYELPWNPNRLEQRNGRIDRFGQPKDKVVIRTLVMNDTLEADILRVLVEKAKRIREDYGFSPPFFDDETSIIQLIQEHKPQYKYGPKQTTLDEFMKDKKREEDQIIDPFDPNVIKQINDDSFYGGIEIGLGEVQQRLNYTYQLIGSPEEIEKFVKSGLIKYNCTLKEKGQKILDIHLSEELLGEGTFSEKLEGVTFDPNMAFKDSSLEVIDLGHPIVRKLIEKIKISSFTDDDSYGRSAVLKVDVECPVSAIFHILGRYIVETDPPSIIEELFEFGMEVFSGKELTFETMKMLQSAKIKSMDRSIEEIKDDLKEAILFPQLEQLIQDKADLRTRELQSERVKMKERLQDQAPKDWLKGIDHITLASVDILALTLYYPSRGV